MKGKLILADGSVFWGELLQPLQAVGEVVFNTGMAGYQEILTDPSYCGQMVVLTYPLIGNYGVSAGVGQSSACYASGLIISELCNQPSNWRSEGTLAEYLKEHSIPCLYGVDTRAITKQIRSNGAMKGIIVSAETDQVQVDALLAQSLEQDVVARVTTNATYTIDGDGPHVVVMDFGIKRNILHSLHRKTGCRLTVVPAATSAAQVMQLQPDGVFLSNGPGDPKAVPHIVAEVKQLIGQTAIFGICLGHQLIALALGADTYKMKFGHRGCNQPVKNLQTGQVRISSQNHGYAVDEQSLAATQLSVTHRSVNDGTIEGLKHNSLPVFSVQFHPEAAPGPDDNADLFDAYAAMLARGK